MMMVYKHTAESRPVLIDFNGQFRYAVIIPAKCKFGRHKSLSHTLRQYFCWRDQGYRDIVIVNRDLENITDEVLTGYSQTNIKHGGIYGYCSNGNCI